MFFCLESAYHQGRSGRSAFNWFGVEGRFFLWVGVRVEVELLNFSHFQSSSNFTFDSKTGFRFKKEVSDLKSGFGFGNKFSGFWKINSVFEKRFSVFDKRFRFLKKTFSLWKSCSVLEKEFRFLKNIFGFWKRISVVPSRLPQYWITQQNTLFSCTKKEERKNS